MLWLQLSPFTAACPASYPYEALTRVVVGQDHLFAAMFDGIGGSKAARHCLVHSHEILLQHLKHNDPDKALRETFNELDKSYFASDLPELVRGCSAHACYLKHMQVRTAVQRCT